MTYNRDWLEEYPYWSYEDAMAVVWDNFPYDWADYWGIKDSHAPEHLDPDRWEEAKRLQGIGKRSTLRTPEAAGETKPRRTGWVRNGLRTGGGEGFWGRGEAVWEFRARLRRGRRV